MKGCSIKLIKMLIISISIVINKKRMTCFEFKENRESICLSSQFNYLISDNIWTNSGSWPTIDSLWLSIQHWKEKKRVHCMQISLNSWWTPPLLGPLLIVAANYANEVLCKWATAPDWLGLLWPRPAGGQAANGFVNERRSNPFGSSFLLSSSFFFLFYYCSLIFISRLIFAANAKLLIP